MLLLGSLPSQYESLSDTLIYGRDSLTLEEVQSALFSKELNRKFDVGGDQAAKGLNVRGWPKKRDFKFKKGSRSMLREGEKRRCYICGSGDHGNKDGPIRRKKWRAEEP